MKTIIYISSQNMSAAEGEASGSKLKVRGCYKGQIPAGLFQQGRILDQEQAAAYLGGFFNMYNLNRRNVSLVLDSDTVTSRILDVPVLPEKQLRPLLENEFSGAGTSGEMLYDYAVLRRGGPDGARLYAVAAEKALVAAYAELFATIGVTLEGIDLAPLAALRLVQMLPELRQQTFIFALIENNQIETLLFAGGQYEFANRTLLQEQRGTPAAVVEMTRALSHLVQYNYAQSTERPLSSIYISGLLDEELDFCPDIAASLSLPVGAPPPTRAISSRFLHQHRISYGEYIFCLGGLIG